MKDRQSSEGFYRFLRFFVVFAVVIWLITGFIYDTKFGDYILSYRVIGSLFGATIYVTIAGLYKWVLTRRGEIDKNDEIF